MEQETNVEAAPTQVTLITRHVTLENEFEKVKREGDKSYELGANRKHPDLVIEVVVSSGGINKLEAYKRLQIPELW